MSEVGAGRAQNGSARSGPVPSSGGAPMRTPRQVMDARNAREQRRQEEQKAEEQRRLADERRRSAERRAAAMSGATPRVSGSSSQYTPDLSQQQGLFESRGPRVAGSDALGDPTGRTSQDYSTGRTRGPTASSQDQPRAAPQGTASTRRPTVSSNTPRQPPSSNAPPSSGPTGAAGQQRPGASQFPHAFERWETLSSHWEGLTSYWLRKLEQNTEEIRDTVPNAVTLNRQITDLSAAGANLFHAVVELQRLRASSERKFQRWFFETRAENERNREVQAQLETQLNIERGANQDTARLRAEVNSQTEKNNREIAEMRRELMISKEEARRAWEELGRRNQESLETAESLKRGQVTLVGGIQVRPHFSGPITVGSASVSRPGTRDGQQYYVGGGSAAVTGRSQGDERDYYPQEGSPTNTDPFMESASPPHSQRYEIGKPMLTPGTYQPPQATAASASGPSTTVTSSMDQRPSVPTSSLGPTHGSANVPVQVTSQEAQRFYQHAPHETFLHSPPSSNGGAPALIVPTTRENLPSERSYMETMSEGDTEYAIDPAGNIRRDDNGQPIVFRRRQQSTASDEYDTEAEIRREQELSLQYGGLAPPEAPSVPTTSAAAMAGYTPAPAGTPATSGPDYEGSGFGGWDTLQTRHHHPTRLSDVLEEEEERSSRRTGD